MFKKIMQNIVKETMKLDYALSKNTSKDINAEIARDNYQLYQKELEQQAQTYIEKWCEQIKTASREGKKFIYTNSFLVFNDRKIELVRGDDGYCYDFSPNSSIEHLKEYFVERGFDVIVEKEDHDWCRLIIRWMD